MSVEVDMITISEIRTGTTQTIDNQHVCSRRSFHRNASDYTLPLLRSKEKVQTGRSLCTACIAKLS